MIVVAYVTCISLHMALLEDLICSRGKIHGKEMLPGDCPLCWDFQSTRKDGGKGGVPITHHVEFLN